MFGESFNPNEEPTKCISADPSVARIQFRQYREWVIQPSSKADAHRLNLEYNDAIIDFILNEIRKPGVCDEIIDLKKLGLRRQKKKVEFESTPSIIPILLSASYSQSHGGNESEGYESDTPSEDVRSSPSEDVRSSDSQIDDLPRGRQGTILHLAENDSTEDVAIKSSRSKLTAFDSTFEMSKDLMEHIPLEVLKRLVMRWPVDGEESIMDQESLSWRRLLIHVWDCSGDPLQLSVIPLFFSSRSIYLLTYDKRNDINKPSLSFVSHKLSNLKGSSPTNGEVLEEWLGGVIAQSNHLPSNPQPISRVCPQLPPLIFVTPFADVHSPKPFDQFFSLSSFEGYRHHMLEPNFVSVSNLYEDQLSSEYRSHYYLRREIDYLARQMPYIRDMIPVQWVMFEQLLHSLIDQKKVVIQLVDLERYISEWCDINGPLQVQPVLAYYADVGLIVHFHRHPALAPLVVIKPQWLLDALSSMFSSSSTNWITSEVRSSFQRLTSEGHIRRDVLLLAYRCARLPQSYWNEVLYFMNYMDLFACHPSLHENTAIYIPSLVSQTPPAFAFGPTGDDPTTLFFSCGVSTCPLSLFNQLIVRCIRSSRYPPVLYYGIVHLRLNSTHHLILRRDSVRISVLVQCDTERFCTYCPSDESSYDVISDCQHLNHIIDHDKDLTPGEHLQTYQSFLDELPDTSLNLSDSLSTLVQVCPMVLSFLEASLEFIISCWYPGLVLQLSTESGEVINQIWKQKERQVSPKLAIWFH